MKRFNLLSVFAIAIVLLFFSSCSTYNPVACTDFGASGIKMNKAKHFFTKNRMVHKSDMAHHSKAAGNPVNAGNDEGFQTAENTIASDVTKTTDPEISYTRDAVENSVESNEAGLVASNDVNEPVLSSLTKSSTELKSFSPEKNSDYKSVKSTVNSLPQNSQELKKHKVNRVASFIAKRFAHKKNTTSVKGGVNRVLLIILAIFIPPIAVLISKGLGVEFLIDILLTLLFWLPGIIYALYLIL
jgi:uncharacterized membrane protein YqaE (UPF0057 family)